MEVQTVYLIMGYFVGFEKYGIDVFYNRKYQRWLVENSTDAESLNSENNNFNPEFDVKGFIVNAKFTAFHNSIPLTEKDFIDIQLNRLNVFLELKDLKSMDLLQIQHFKKYLENRSIEYQQPIAEAIQRQNELNKYIQSYKHNFFSSITNKRNEDGKENVLFYGKRTLELLNRTGKELNLKENLKDRYDLLNLYNSHLHHLITNIIQLYKAINAYNNTDNEGYLTVIAIKKNEIFNSLKSIKGFSEKIKDDVIDGNIDKAIRIKTYFLSKLDVLIAFLDNTIGIEIYKSPLQTDFEEVKFILKSSINLDELKIINELNKVAPEVPKQSEMKIEQESGKIKAPVLALFCSLIDKIGIDKKEETESAPNYCQRICLKYGFNYTDRVRQNYYGMKTKAIQKEFIDKVLPILDDGIKDLIQKHLNNK